MGRVIQYVSPNSSSFPSLYVRSESQDSSVSSSPLLFINITDIFPMYVWGTSGKCNVLPHLTNKLVQVKLTMNVVRAR